MHLGIRKFVGDPVMEHPSKDTFFLNRGIYRCQCPGGLSRWQNIKCFDQKTVACSVMMMMMIEK